MIQLIQCSWSILLAESPAPCMGFNRTETALHSIPGSGVGLGLDRPLFSQQGGQAVSLVVVFPKSQEVISYWNIHTTFLHREKIKLYRGQFLKTYILQSYFKNLKIMVE